MNFHELAIEKSLCTIGLLTIFEFPAKTTNQSLVNKLRKVEWVVDGANRLLCHLLKYSVSLRDQNVIVCSPML